MRSMLHTNKGGRLVGYMRSVSLFTENQINKNKKLSYSYSSNLQNGINRIHDKPEILHNQLYLNMINSNFYKLGTETHGGDVSFHQTYSSNYILSNSNNLSPEKFFHLNGKEPPVSLDVSAPDPLKPVTSIVEVATVGFISSKFPNTKIFQSKQIVNKNSPFNFSKQPCPDSRLEVLLNDGNIFTCWIDSKTMDSKVLFNRLSSLTNYRGGDTLRCNFYFVGGLKRTHVFSFKETNGILKVIHNQCNELLNTNDPVAISFVNQNIPFINKFSNSGSILDLQKSQISPYFFSQPHFGLWFSGLNNH